VTSTDLSSLRPGETVETKWLDFKALIDPKQDGAQQELCRDVAQFANTEGGSLLIGVGEKMDSRTRLKVISSIIGVKDPDRIREWIEQAIQNHLTPKTFSHYVDFIALGSTTVIAVNVPPSRHLVAVWDKNTKTIEYLYRTSHGKDWMNPDEAEMHITSGSRFGRISIVQTGERLWKELQAMRPPRTTLNVDLISGVWQRQNANAALTRLILPGSETISLGWPIAEDADVFIVSMAGKVVHLPFGAIRDAWVTKLTTGTPAIGLLLSLRVVRVAGDFVLEPWAIDA
jgi:hypothetical protein